FRKQKIIRDLVFVVPEDVKEYRPIGKLHAEAPLETAPERSHLLDAMVERSDDDRLDVRRRLDLRRQARHYGSNSTAGCERRFVRDKSDVHDQRRSTGT